MITSRVMYLVGTPCFLIPHKANLQSGVNTIESCLLSLLLHAVLMVHEVVPTSVPWKKKKIISCLERSIWQTDALKLQMDKQRKERMEAFGAQSGLPLLQKLILWYGIFSDIMAKVCS